REEYAVMKAGGADRYLMRHETSDPELFARLRPGTSLEERVERQRWLLELGYQVGSGFMVGLPGQTAESLANDILLLRELDVEMAGIGPFIPHPDTPLGQCTGGTLEMTLKVLAAIRLVLPMVHLPATTAVGSIDPFGRQKALNCGCNVIMPNVTPGRYREGYQLYPNKICLVEEPVHCRPCVEAIIYSQNRNVARGKGHSPKPGPWA
ncbi:MAG: [FeFe] hydrogenase H-cluster radical SAM maturase HydE, partial [Mycobacterium leprae]